MCSLCLTVLPLPPLLHLWQLCAAVFHHLSLWLVPCLPTLMKLPVTLGQHDVVLPPPLTLKDTGGVVGLATVPQQQPLSHKPPQASVSYAMEPPQVSLLRVEPPTDCLYMLLSVLVNAFLFQVSCTMLYSLMGAQMLGFTPLWPFRAYPWEAFDILVKALAHTRYALSDCLLHCFK